MNAGIIFLLYITGWKVSIGSLQQGEVLALINYMNQMLLALIVVSNLVLIFTRASASAARVNEVLSVTSSITTSNQTELPSETAKETSGIIFEDVSFRYQPDAGLTLKSINLHIPKGSILGITGATGSGKSTLTQLIPRFYDTSEGRVIVDGLDVRSWPLDELRRKISMVPQTPVLFSGTIRENLQWGKEDANDEDCWEALEIANAKSL